MRRNKRKKGDSLPVKFKTVYEVSDFWDTHDLGDYWDETREVLFDVNIKKERNYCALEKDLSEKIDEVARLKGVSPETLVNLWLRENYLKKRGIRGCKIKNFLSENSSVT